MPIDIDKSYYNTGTATVAADGTTVTGQGTAWLQAIRPGDLFGTHVGDGTRILSVDSNTQLTLAYPWKGAAQTAAAYEIQFTPYDVGYQQATRELLQKLASGNVEALAGLSGGPDLIPYFTGPGAMALTALTSFARSLLDDADPATAQQTLGGGATGRSLFGAADVASALGTLGIVGFGSTRADPPGNDLNSATASGVYNVGASVINTPDGNGPSGSVCLTLSWSSAICAQLFFRRSTTSLFYVYARFQHNAGEWTTWSRVNHNLTAVGAVSQSGGTPTGALIERGSNSNGNYVKFADGTQICTGSVTLTYLSSAVLRGVWTFPSSFSVSPDISAIVSGRSTTPALTQLSSMECSGIGLNTVGRFDIGRTPGQTDFQSGDTVTLSVQAIGRWF